LNNIERRCPVSDAEWEYLTGFILLNRVCPPGSSPDQEEEGEEAIAAAEPVGD
jgi:hypothetical protein